MGATGFEPVKAEPADLQSAPFGHLGTRPKFFPPPGCGGSLNIRLCWRGMQGEREFDQPRIRKIHLRLAPAA